MKVCPVCGTPMEYDVLPDNKVKFTCPVCGHTIIEEVTEPIQKTKGLRIEASERIGEGVIEEKYSFDALTDLVSCPKCHHSPVEYTYLQTRSADEPPVRIYRCPKCGHTWREY